MFKCKSFQTSTLKIFLLKHGVAWYSTSWSLTPEKSLSHPGNPQLHASLIALIISLNHRLLWAGRDSHGSLSPTLSANSPYWDWTCNHSIIGTMSYHCQCHLKVEPKQSQLFGSSLWSVIGRISPYTFLWFFLFCFKKKKKKTVPNNSTKIYYEVLKFTEEESLGLE